MPFWPYQDIKTKNHVKLVNSWPWSQRKSQRTSKSRLTEEEERAAATVPEEDEIDPDDEEIAEISRPRVRRVEARRHLEPVFSFLFENPNIPGQAAHLRAIRDLMFVLEQANVAGILARTGQVSIDSCLRNVQRASGSHSAV